MDKERPQPKLLIVDDDRELVQMLREFLAPEHLEVSACGNGEAGLQALQNESFDLLILDVMLPGMSGMEVLRELRNSSDIPVIMLTARGDDVDRILGLEFGADDYLPKPFNPRELLARIRAILRRARVDESRQAPLSVGILTLDASARQVSAAGKNIPLTATEFELLHCLAESPGEVIARDVLSQQVLGRRLQPYDRSIDTHISNVRGKLASHGVQNPTIRSRRGIGYMLVPGE